MDRIFPGAMHPAQFFLLFFRRFRLFAAQFAFGARHGHAFADAQYTTGPLDFYELLAPHLGDIGLKVAGGHWRAGG